jgi:osmoprotectant transport system permease protein
MIFVTDLASAWQRSPDFWAQTLVFISLTLRALGLVLLLAVPTGIALTWVPRLASPLIAALGLVQTVPSMVVLGLCIVIFRTDLVAAALVAAILYSVFPVVLNTYIGLTQVAPSVRDAARGMGMTDRQVLWNVDLPLALPVMLAGIRNGAVAVSGMIVIGSLVGAGGLGDYIWNGINRADAGMIALGCVPVLILTLMLFWALGGLAWFARKNSDLGMAAGGALIVLLSTYAVLSFAVPALQSRPAEVRIGAKDFTEGQILAEVVKQMLDSHTGLTTEIKSNLGTGVILKALNAGQIDLYPEYTGNLLTSKDALDAPIPEDRSTITSLVRKEMQRRYGLVLLEPFGLNNTYAPCVTAATAQKYGLKRISDLQRTPQLRVVIDLSFRTRPDGWDGLVQHYNLHFDQAPKQVSPNLIYKALEQEAADLVIGFATDWQIRTLSLVVLEDDRDYFPNYHAAPLVREALLNRHPQIAVVLNKLGGRIDDDTMRQLNYAVAVERRSEAEVAHDFLQKHGLLRQAAQANEP